MACDHIKRDKRPNLNKYNSAWWLCTELALLKYRVNRNVENRVALVWGIKILFKSHKEETNFKLMEQVASLPIVCSYHTTSLDNRNLSRPLLLFLLKPYINRFLPLSSLPKAPIPSPCQYI